MSDRARQKDQVFLRVANVIADLGTCPRKAVGAVIVRDGRAISWGFNGAPPGVEHCDSLHGWSPRHLYGKYVETQEGILMDVVKTLGWKPTEENHSVSDILIHVADALGCRNVTHAEANALAFAAKQGISTEGGTLYVTLSPCVTCARLLIASGIKRVVFGEQYRIDEGTRLLREAGVEVH